MKESSVCGQGVKPGFCDAVHRTVTKITPSLHQVRQFIMFFSSEILHLIEILQGEEDVEYASCVSYILRSTNTNHTAVLLYDKPVRLMCHVYNKIN